MATSTLPRVTFETTECSRCGGTGEFSYNPLDGTRCFKCRGGKRQLTRRGAAARKAWDAVVETMARPITEVRVGDKVKTTEGWAIVESIGHGGCRYGRGDDAVESIDLRFSKIRTVFCMQPGSTAKVWSDEIYLAAVERVRKLAGATVTRARVRGGARAAGRPPGCHRAGPPLCHRPGWSSA